MSDKPAPRIPGADRWQRVEDLFTRAADLPPSDRTALLGAECRTADGLPDPVLRAEVEALIQHDVQARAFFDDANARLAAVADGIGAEQDALPERVGPWRLVREIGRGGMGTVHLAERADGRFEQTAALKLVRAGMAPGVLARFRSERQILARLDHPGIARLLDGGVADDERPYLVMEYVDGEPITDYCDRRRLSVDARLALFRQVCDAVQFAHRQLVVHRDLKPSNILVAEDATGAPRVKLLDFGIAKLLAGDAAVSLVETAEDQRVMTPEYAAPEQVRGEPVTTATDVYALGVLLYELLTGTRPYRLANRARHAVERAILETDPAVPSTSVTDATAAGARASEPTRLKRKLRGDLDQIVLRALRKAPERRYDGAAALSSDIGRHLNGLPVEAQPESVGYRMGKFARRHRAAVAVAAVALLAMLAGTVAIIQQRDRARDQATRAEEVTTLLVSVFDAADPLEGRPDTLSVQDVLAAGTERVEAELAARPTTQADLFLALARVHRNLQEYARAEALSRRSLAQARAADDQPRIADALVELSRTLSALDRPTEAAEAAIQAVEADRRAGSPDRDIARGLGALAAVRHAQGEIAEMERLIGMVTEIYDENGMDPDEQYADLLEYQGTARLSRGDGDGALADYRRSLAITQDRYGSDHTRTLARQSTLAFALGWLGRWDEAATQTLQHIRALEGRFGVRDPRVVHHYGALAIMELHRDRPDIADTLVQVVLETLPPSARGYGNAVRAAAGIAAKRGDFAEEERRLRMLVTSPRPDRVDTGLIANRHANLAYSIVRQGRFQEAERIARHALAIREDLGVPSTAGAGWARAVLGMALAGQGRIGEARPELTAGAELLQSYASNNPWRLAAEKALADLPASR